MDYDSIVEMDAGACVGHASPHALLADSQSLLSKLVALNEGGGVFLTDSSLIWDLHKSLGNGVEFCEDDGQAPWCRWRRWTTRPSARCAGSPIERRQLELVSQARTPLALACSRAPNK
jgi:hypothetical protein